MTAKIDVSKNESCFQLTRVSVSELVWFETIDLENNHSNYIQKRDCK